MFKLNQNEAELAAASIAKIIPSWKFQASQSAEDDSWQVVGFSTTVIGQTKVIEEWNFPIGPHCGVDIFLDIQEGYHAKSGLSFGYCDTIDELKEELDDYWSGAGFGPLNGFFADAEGLT